MLLESAEVFFERSALALNNRSFRARHQSAPDQFGLTFPLAQLAAGRGFIPAAG
jgi:hypothetical protein